MKPQEKTLLDVASNGSLTKYKTVTEAWQLITDLVESTRNARQRTNHPKAIAEVSSSSETAALTKTLGEMTNILKQLQLNQQQPPPPPQQQCQQEESRGASSREDIHVEDIVEVEDVEEEDEVQNVGEEEVAQPRSRVPKEDDVVRKAIPIPFPHLARRTKKQVELDPKMVEIFKKVEVTILLFYAICQMPKYAKFLKDLCMNKDKIHDLETISLGSSISALMGAIPKKYGDPGPCIVTCTIGGVQFVDCMCDLGACLSIMPLSVYDALRLPSLKRSVARFVLADKSIISVVGIAEDVLVSIKGLAFLIDFYILEMPPSDSGRPSFILLGRPFLKTSQFKLDAFSGTYSFEIDGIVVSFNLDEAMKHPLEDQSIF
ncbi:uncharacterized protein LOC130975366 [Arachis stenosperma]|uniref:uncharacterized protein LOC130975366 n=1 Tax=Arachis stenosperma TaxID=217475 RepID=UPI0025ACE7D5|nr:uncharacterized protein LOC130975366 [Arachis stenosperma]